MQVRLSSQRIAIGSQMVASAARGCSEADATKFPCCTSDFTGCSATGSSGLAGCAFKLTCYSSTGISEFAGYACERSGGSQDRPQEKDARLECAGEGRGEEEADRGVHQASSNLGSNP